MNERMPFVELECCQFTKDDQSVCGDDFLWERLEDEDRNIAVLSDGLGSGIKANLLAHLTTTMAMKFVKSNMDILQATETIMDTLPVCEVRKISYATFSIVDMRASGRTRIIEMGNPSCIQLRGLEEVEPLKRDTVRAERWPDRPIEISELEMRLGDRLIVCSDGVTQAGIGTDEYRFGWERKGCMEFARELIDSEPEISARDLSQAIARKAMSIHNGHCLDDISCLVIYLRRPRMLRILTGPPYHREDDGVFAELAAEPEITSIICGGTTANIVQRELRAELSLDITRLEDGGGLPPPGYLRGVGMITEGILTLTSVANALESDDWERAPLSARKIVEQLLDSDVIEFIVGTRVNEAHQDPALPMDLEIRRNIVLRLVETLTRRHRKKVSVRYF